ncbi:universal stress protein [Roseivivax sediminis]|uniref:Nucleotide-binding universal stress protein, UspA family n=1 Tax=Roseivivax sediminis TaxID=936889 RepID=A0A1I2BNZ1_9RHOB|nr:universal stress protein [Roseivivax sediminis]SFE57852.1 Nucleotide-binding universal stress protein, UspA family [Roseivivax sediminis]
MFKKILIPVAPDHAEAIDDSIAVARKLAGPDTKITALSVLEVVPLYVAAEVPTEVYERSCQEMQKTLTEAFRDLPEVEVRAVTGSPASRIVDEVRDEGFDLIVIRSHKPGIQDWFLGSTAGRVVRHAPCSVHVVR